ncbi:MAG TPA: hypothetical protein VGM90_15705 [Kofleriaceae bacterium]|jgi:hypothetical protein
MRLLCMLTVTLFAATASADTHTVNVEVVRVLPDTQQVLVLDKTRNTHVLLTVGSAVGDDIVVSIDGIGMTLETRENERFTVYPRAAQGLALNLDKSTKNDLPAVYSTVEPTPASTEVAQNAAIEELSGAIDAMDSTTQMAVQLAGLFFAPTDDETGATSALIVSLK